MSDVRPKKELGQHWLHDPVILDAILTDAQISKDDVVLEIGPGLGTLTEPLLATGARIVALEFDEVLADSLRTRLETRGVDISALEVLRGDIRSFDYSALASNFKIVANIPYYLTSYLLRALCDTEHKPSVSVLLMQKEVAERIVSGNKKSLLSVITQYFYEVRLGVMVGREYFTPPPKVDSQVLVLVRREDVLFAADQKVLLRLFKAGFSEKRKNLRNALSGGLQISKDEAVRLLTSAQIAETRRAESLNWEEWQHLYMSYVELT